MTVPDLASMTEAELVALAWAALAESARRRGGAEVPPPPFPAPPAADAPAGRETNFAAPPETPEERRRRLTRERVSRFRSTKRHPTCNAPGNAVTLGSVTGVTPSDSPDCVCVSSFAGKEEENHTHTQSPSPRERALPRNAVTQPVTQMSVTPPVYHAGAGFEEWWSAWVQAVPPERRTGREAAGVAWVAGDYAGRPGEALRQLRSWQATGEWKRGAVPMPAKFLSDPKYTELLTARPRKPTAPEPVPAAVVRSMLAGAPPPVQDAAVGELMDAWAAHGGSAAMGNRRRLADARHNWADAVEQFGHKLADTAAAKAWAAKERQR